MSVLKTKGIDNASVRIDRLMWYEYDGDSRNNKADDT